MIEVLIPNPENIQKAAQAILHGQIVGMPTETVYGLAGHGLRSEAVMQIFRAKERPLFDPLILHISPEMRAHLDTRGITQIGLLPADSQKKVFDLMDRFWPGPLTLVLPRGPAVPDLVTSGLDSVAMRMPSHSVAQQLIAAVGAPLAAPSANRFGRISPTCAKDVVEELGDRIPYVLDGGPCSVGVESTVLAATLLGEFVLLRPGGISATDLKSILGVAPQFFAQHQKSSPTPVFHSPGMLPSHYAPRTPLHVSTDLIQLCKSLDLKKNTRVAVLTWFDDPQEIQKKLEIQGLTVVAQARLSGHQNSEEAAQKLFSHLRRLDAASAQLILAEIKSEPEGIGFAIQDRLLRAAGVGEATTTLKVAKPTATGAS